MRCYLQLMLVLVASAAGGGAWSKIFGVERRQNPAGSAKPIHGQAGALSKREGGEVAEHGLRFTRN